MEENSTRMMGVNCRTSFSSASRERHSRSTSGMHEDILNKSPRLFQHSHTFHLDRLLNNQNSLSLQEIASGRSSITTLSTEVPTPKTVHLERKVDNRNLLCFQEISSGRSSITSASLEVPTPKPASELVKEISALELEVINMERYLLSLYRTAFDQYLAGSTTTSSLGSRSPLECQSVLQVNEFNVQTAHQIPPESSFKSSDEQADSKQRSHTREIIEKKSTNACKNARNSSAHDLAARSGSYACSSSDENSNKDQPKVACGHRSLADHLGASLIDHVPDIPCRLSEDILRCISAIYCKLANPLRQPIDPLASVSPSISSSSTFSPQDPYDNWSPRCHYEATTSPCLLESLKDKQNPYSNMVEIPRICIDGDRFCFASKMLNNFRSLIRRLETVDPKKMDYEGQLAFWINTHNALVMHAFLAYGLHQNHMKSSYSILKAAYNVGGVSINAYEIQSLILGCQPHRQSLWLRAFFNPSKFMKGNDRHPYALDHPEPLVHFALSMGGHSDPAVRVYNAKRVFPELKVAKEEYIQSNVLVRNEKKIILPKILYYYAKDASLEPSDLLGMVQTCMPKAQQKVIQGCLEGKLDKCVQWSSYKSGFRYLVHRDLDN